ncbi:SDR family oxidoreductase [Rivibacter subsaxonicus]|uniref:NAD(P)-dependent dehydrogenase (Short-subunit alcohol dehydrogenase family) n=1 Tax=Rivibacter subsaxonicus TaxID=457575 RepID=A0A4Q7VZU4_9BURK|nr:SDR family oxidoreductase [Rivibacter subsaxonicus]RZU02098.1 NAD(P)-dependent dehydrogenase (short-subunit alcohol dehydrogenase family) [Rivibacter subsaxonicus]
MRALVIGASRGIGLEFVRQYRADGAQVTATARDEAGLGRLRALGASAVALDVTSAESCSRLAWQLDGGAFDVVIVNAGVYGPRSSGIEAPSEADFDAVMHANVLGPMRVVGQIAELLEPQARLAVISSRMGAIGPRTSASGWLYRASKAALNSVLKDISITLGANAGDEAAAPPVCVAFHPGWVRTDMGGSGADLDVADAVAGMRRTLAALTAADNGRFLNYDGSGIDW